MTNYIAILRGINVGGNRKLLMADLKTICKGLGFQNIKTYIQSGNVIFHIEEQEHNKLATTLEMAIKKNHGFDVPVVVRTLAELKKIQDQNPFLKNADTSIDELHLTFLSEDPSTENLKKIETYNYTPDEFKIIGHNAFIKIPGKYHKSKLTNSFFEKKLQVKATTRNWKTVLKLMELAEKI